MSRPTPVRPTPAFPDHSAVQRDGAFTLADGLVIDGAAFELRRGELRIVIEPKPLGLLLYLIRHRRRVVAKAELLDTFWADTHVAEVALSRAVCMARKALRDAGAEHEAIRNVRGRGYQFVGSVHRAEPARLSVESVARRVEELRASVVCLNQELRATMDALQTLLQTQR